VPVAESAVWFTDGGGPVRIGSTLGNAYHGFQVVGAAEGSTLVWREGTGDEPGPLVVYDTGSMRELGRLGDENAVLLAVLADAVYWAPPRTRCTTEADFGCLRWRTVRRFDTATRTESEVAWEAFVAERRSRPGVVVGRYDGDAPVRGLVDYGDLAFDRHGDRLVSDSRAVDVRPRLAGSHRPVRLRVPADQPATRFSLVQWLDGDRVVLIGYRGLHGQGTELNDAGDLLVCQLSTGSCRVQVHGGRRPLAVPLAD
jgi:hypothetical protein